VYLLADAFAHPVDAEAAGVIVAAFAIAIAMLLFLFLFEPRRFPEILRRKKPERITLRRADGPARLPVAAPHDLVPSDLPYHRTFVDRSCIRPRTPSPAQARGIAGK
jgi:hypothetical protein